MFEYNYELLSRIARSEVGQKYMQQLKSEYERDYENQPIYALDYSLFKRFYIDILKRVIVFCDNFFSSIKRFFVSF